MARAQLPLPALEAGIGVVLLLTLALVLAGGVTPADTERAQLDVYASDVGQLLRSEAPRHAGGTRLSEVLASRTAFEREREALARRVDSMLPANLRFRVHTAYGGVGNPQPAGVAVGEWSVRTRNGRVTLEVWYA